LAARRDRLYTAVHRALIEALAEMGELSVVSCQLSVDPRPTSGYPGYPAADGQRTTDNEQRTLIPQSPIPNPQSPFFCFQRRTPGDVLLLGHKIAGSAQRRRRGAVLQHGSLLLRRSPAAPELPGLEDITGRAIPAEAIMTPWLRRLGHILGVSWAEGGLSEMEARRAADLLLTRYARAGQLGGTPCF
jgi:lipoate-protein ligase A